LWLLDHPEHLGVHRLMKDLNRAYAESPAIWSRDHEPESFQWIDANDAGRNVFSFIRRGVSTGSSSGPSELVCVCNFSAVPHGDFRLGLPAAGEWHEVVNTDASTYTGSGVGNLGTVTAQEGSTGSGQPAHATLVLPPLATIWLRRD
jgi:1,4-alpha-glucan branching enzyme